MSSINHYENRLLRLMVIEFCNAICLNSPNIRYSSNTSILIGLGDVIGLFMFVFLSYMYLRIKAFEILFRKKYFLNQL